jgi:hypothetical protein
MMSTLKTFPRVATLTWIRGLTITALTIAGVLLLSNLASVPDALHAYLSSIPLALAGFGYAILQLRANPPRGILLKRLLLAATFVIWAVDQLLPSGRLATFIGDVVIAAYVLDLFWLIQEQATEIKPISDR